ncbi:MAG: hypothetical protein OXG56_07515 [Gammaproteobacteria bacterium]|nr:hypothetical protein [Gammaproteobacteria bacterium]
MDPIYQLTGLSRTTQFLAVSTVFGIILLTKWFAQEKWRRPIDLTSTVGLRRGIILLFALIFLNSVAASLRAILHDVSSQYWAMLLIWVFFVMVLQAAFVHAALSLTQRLWVQLVLPALFSTFNFFALYFALSDRFSTLSIGTQTVVVFIIFLSFIFFFVLVGKRILSLRNVNSVLGVTAVGMFIVLVASVLYTPKNESELTSFADIRFRTTPNIHILSIDALIPASLAEKYMALSPSTDLPYDQILDDSGVIAYKNAFASRVPTKPSLTSVMLLAHTDFYREDNYPYFAGRANGPVTHVFHSNGYKIWTGFNQPHFGRKGPFVDFYHPGQTQPFLHSALCRLAVQNPIRYFGICSFMSLITDDREPEQNWSDQIIDIIDRSVREYTTPVFTLHYTNNPIGHTPSGFRMADQQAFEQYIELYRTGALKTAEMMEHLRDLIESDGEPSVFIVVGDHGAYLSTGIDPDDDESFFVQDRYGILATILVNETDCSTEQLKYYTPSFATPERILAGIMRCLASDPVVFDTLMDFDEDFSFDEFLYE